MDATPMKLSVLVRHVVDTDAKLLIIYYNIAIHMYIWWTIKGERKWQFGWQSDKNDKNPIKRMSFYISNATVPRRYLPYLRDSRPSII